MKIASIGLVAVIVLAYVAGMFATQQLYTEIDIDAPPKVVWDHLTEFSQYPKWNPFIKQISGELAAGSQLSVSIQPPGQDSMDFSPELLVVKEYEELRWLGQLLIPKLFDGEHYFIVEAKSDGTTRLIQGENFSGILALLLWGTVEQDTKNGFHAMNKALKNRSEASG